jgi:hypothetical protein
MLHQFSQGPFYLGRASRPVCLIAFLYIYIYICVRVCVFYMFSLFIANSLSSPLGYFQLRTCSRFSSIDNENALVGPGCKEMVQGPVRNIDLRNGPV